MSASDDRSEPRDYDLLAPATHTDDPWPMYDWMLAERPLYWDKTNEVWAVSRYDDVVALSKDPETFTSTEGNRPNLPADPSMINQDGKAHLTQRKLVNKGFLPRSIRQIEDDVRAIAKALIAEVGPRGACEFIEDLAAPLPRNLIGDMLGIPREDLPALQRYTDEFVKGGCGPAYVTEDVNEAFGHFMMYHVDLVEKRRQCPGEDLISIWVNAEIDGEKLNDMQLLFEHVLLFVGGSETTRNAISGGFEALMKHPDQRQRLLDEPVLIPNAVEEIIRWTAPFVNMVRTATRDVELHGRTIRKGEQIELLYPAANRDPRHFPDPYRFDVGREFTSPILAFGHGPHYCLGANLARLEVRVALEEWLPKLQNLRLAPGEAVERQPSSFIRAIKHMPVVFDAFDVDASATSAA